MICVSRCPWTVISPQPQLSDRSQNGRKPKEIGKKQKLGDPSRPHASSTDTRHGSRYVPYVPAAALPEDSED